MSACPTQAMFRREDGIVDFNKSVCIGCNACIAACPYDAIFTNPEDDSAEKCNGCSAWQPAAPACAQTGRRAVVLEASARRVWTRRSTSAWVLYIASDGRTAASRP